jgi:DNA repair protein RecO (recombination protein O)
MSRSRVYATQAIVLRRSDTGEADRLLTILTPARGKLRVIAKGARKIASRKAGHIELFAQSRLMLAQARSYDLITQAELVEPYLLLREDVLRGSLAHYLCELTEQFAHEEHEDSALFDLLSNGLRWLCEAQDPVLSARYFEMQLLTLGGYRPQLLRCAITNTPLEVDSDPDSIHRGTPFSPVDGGALARVALPKAREWMTLTHQGIGLLRMLQSQTHETAQSIAASLTPQAHVEMERALQATLSVVTERRARTLAFVKLVS